MFIQKCKKKYNGEDSLKKGNIKKFMFVLDFKLN